MLSLLPLLVPRCGVLRASPGPHQAGCGLPGPQLPAHGGGTPYRMRSAPGFCWRCCLRAGVPRSDFLSLLPNSPQDLHRARKQHRQHRSGRVHQPEGRRSARFERREMKGATPSGRSIMQIGVPRGAVHRGLDPWRGSAEARSSAAGSRASPPFSARSGGRRDGRRPRHHHRPSVHRAELKRGLSARPREGKPPEGTQTPSARGRFQ
jgi:hypothetical protein